MSHAYSDKLLLDETPIVLQPTLAVTIGLNEALFIQQLHYWINYSHHIFDGRKWVYNTFDKWQEKLPFISTSTIKRIIKKIKSEKILLTANFNASTWDRTIWYSIDYDVLNRYIAEKIDLARNAKEEAAYFNPATGEEYPLESVPENLKIPVSPNQFQQPDVPEPQNDVIDPSIESIPLAQNEPMHKFKSDNALGQIDTMQKNAQKSMVLPLGQNEPMESIKSDNALGQNEPIHLVSKTSTLGQIDTMDLVSLTQTIPLENTLEKQHQKTASEQAPITERVAKKKKGKDSAVVDLKSFDPDAYHLAVTSGVDPAAVVRLLREYPIETLRQYLILTISIKKAMRIANPTGWFISAVRNNYSLEQGHNQNLSRDYVPQEIIRKTEEDMMRQYQANIANYPPIQPDSPLYKFLKKG